MPPIDSESKKIEKWADVGDRTDPDDASLNPTLTRATGWPATFSATDGETIRRRVTNQILRELTGIAVDTRDEGVLGWDAEIDYLQDAITKVGAAALYSASVATGPGTSNATEPDHGWPDGVGHVSQARPELPQMHPLPLMPHVRAQANWTGLATAR